MMGWPRRVADSRARICWAVARSGTFRASVELWAAWRAFLTDEEFCELVRAVRRLNQKRIEEVRVAEVLRRRRLTIRSSKHAQA